MDWAPVLDFFVTLAPWVSTVFMGLGGVVVVGTCVDSVIPDEKDGGFMKKAFALPIVGDLLNRLARFSPFNIKDKK